MYKEQKDKHEPKHWQNQENKNSQKDKQTKLISKNRHEFKHSDKYTESIVTSKELPKCL